MNPLVAGIAGSLAGLAFSILAVALTVRRDIKRTRRNNLEAMAIRKMASLISENSRTDIWQP